MRAAAILTVIQLFLDSSAKEGVRDLHLQVIFFIFGENAPLIFLNLPLLGFNKTIM